MTYLVRRTVAAIPLALLVVLAMLAVGAAPAAAATTTSTQITIHLPATPFTNLCNGDQVNLRGDETIRVTRTINNDGSSTVRSEMWAPNLSGERYFPLPWVPYTGADAHQNYAYYAPAHFPYTLTVIHWTKLVPQGPAPTMYLVTVLRETILAPTGPPVVTVDRLYLACTEPCRQSTPE